MSDKGTTFQIKNTACIDGCWFFWSWLLLSETMVQLVNGNVSYVMKGERWKGDLGSMRNRSGYTTRSKLAIRNAEMDAVNFLVLLCEDGEWYFKESEKKTMAKKHRIKFGLECFVELWDKFEASLNWGVIASRVTHPLLSHHALSSSEVPITC